MQVSDTVTHSASPHKVFRTERTILGLDALLIPRKPTFLWALTGALYLICLSGIGWTQEYKQAYEETKAEYKAVTESVTQTQEQINEMRGALVKAEKFLKKIPAGPERNKVKRMIRDARKSLNGHSKRMGKFNTYASKVTSGFELISEINGIRETANSRAGGPLAAQMTYVSEALKRYGEDVPIIGKALKAYGEATGAILNATDKCTKKVESQRNQDMIGAGTYNFFFNAKYKAMKKQFGAEVADGDTYAPEGVRCVYRSINNPSKAFIWDEQAGEWYKVSNGAADLEQAYREGLLIGKRRSPFELKVLADKWDEVQARRKEADILYDKLYGMRYGSIAFMNVDEKSKGALSELLGDREIFRAYFTYDKDGRKKIDGLIDDMKTEIKRLEEEEEKAKAKEREQEEKERLKRRKEFLAKQRDQYEKNHGKKLNDREQRTVNGLHRQIGDAIESIGKSQGRIDEIISDSQSRMNTMQEKIQRLEEAIAEQLRKAAEFQQKVAKIIAETKKEETRKKFEKHLEDCQKALGDQSFCTAHAGGYYDWGVIAYKDLKTHHFGRSIKANKLLIETYRKAIQAAMQAQTSGELRGINQGLEVITKREYYYPSSINDIAQSIQKAREKIKERRQALEAFERINTDPEPNWTMPQLMDPGKAASADNGGT
jgi:hypothetical protein